MATELLILRHAKSSWGAGVASDFERPLSPRGARTAPRVGCWMAERDLVPDFVFASPAVRTRETLALLLDAMGAEPDTRWEEAIYGASLGELIDLLGERPGEARRVLLLGHNPGLEALVGYLGEGGVPTPIGAKAFPTAALAHFVMPDDWCDLQRASGDLVEVLRPRELES